MIFGRMKPVVITHVTLHTVDGAEVASVPVNRSMQNGDTLSLSGLMMNLPTDDKPRNCPVSYAADPELIHCYFNEGHDRVRMDGKNRTLFDHGNPDHGVWWDDDSSFTREGEKDEIVDMVNHPPHYQRGKFEVIDVLQEFFPTEPLIWQVGKYIMRADQKGNQIQDLEKAEWYLRRRIDELKAAVAVPDEAS